MDKLSVLAAWWGAFIATIVLLFELYKWARSGPILRCDTKYGWKITENGIINEHEFIFFSVTNTGDRPTTIVNQGLLYWATLRDKFRKKPDLSWFTKGGLYGFGKVPSIIHPGEVWNGLGSINDGIKESINKGGYLYVSLLFSHRKRPYLFMVKKGKKGPLADTNENNSGKSSPSNTVMAVL